MYRIDNPTADTVLRPPTPLGPRPNGFFAGGDPIAGGKATIVDAEWLNMVQEEISNVVTNDGAGVAGGAQDLDKNLRNQMNMAITQRVTDIGTPIWVEQAGDNMWGNLVMDTTPGIGITWIPPSVLVYGPWDVQPMGFAWDGARPAVRVRVGDADAGFLWLNMSPADFVNVTGDTMTGALNMQGTNIAILNTPFGVTYAPPTVPVYGPWFSNNIGFGWDGANLRARVDDTDLGLVAMNINPGLFVLKAGDTMSGELYIDCWSDLAAGSPAANLELRSGGEPAIVWHRPGAIAIKAGLNNANQFAIGGWSWAANLLTLDGGGNLTTAAGHVANTGNINAAAGDVWGNNVNARASVTAGLDVTAQNNVRGNNFVTGVNGVYCSGSGNYYLNEFGGTNCYINYLPSGGTATWGFDYVYATFDLSYDGWWGNPLCTWDQVGNLWILGALTQGSDAALKRNSEAFEGGLDIVRQLQPRSYLRIGGRDQEIEMPEVGFIAQEIEECFPQAVKARARNYRADPEHTPDSISYYYPTALIAALVNAVQEMDARLIKAGL